MLKSFIIFNISLILAFKKNMNNNNVNYVIMTGDMKGSEIMKTNPAVRKIAIFMVTVLILLQASHLRAEVRTEHPRIWLTPERLSLLSDRMSRNTAAAQHLRSWCDNHFDDDLSNYIQSRAVPTLNAINYALMYQLTDNSSYAQRAVEIIQYILAHPYSNYTIDEWIGFDNYYTDRYLMPPVAIVLDWCWDYMSTSQRDAFIQQLDIWAADLMTGAPWSWEDASTNYFYGHCWALLTTAYAIHGHNDNAEAYLSHARDNMLADGIRYTKGQQVNYGYMGNYTGRSKGGLWNEGTSYGCVDNEFICSAILAVRSAETDKTDYPSSGFPFVNEVVQFYIHALYPSNDHTYADGDGASWGGLGPTSRVPVLLCLNLTDDQHSRYGKFWVDNYTSIATTDYKLYHEFMWYPEETSSADYRGNVEKQYLAEGYQALFWRSGWSENDTWMAFRIGLLNTAHAQNGLGNFIIYQGDYLATDKATETGNSMLVGDVHHNVLYIAPPEEKKLYWGASEIEHYQVTPGYIYLAGDMSPVYNAQPDYRHNTVEHKEREFFLLKEEKALLVMDRGRSFDPGVDKIFQIYLHNQAASGGGNYRSSNGDADLIIHTAYPPDAEASFDTDGPPRIRITTPVSERTKTFLHLLKVTDPGGSIRTAPVEATGADMVGTVLEGESSSSDFMVMFSNRIDGNPPSTDTFSASFGSFGNTVIGYIVNLEPDTQYYYEDLYDGSSVDLTISRNSLGDKGPISTSGEGVLVLELHPGENPSPLEVPGGVKIE